MSCGTIAIGTGCVKQPGLHGHHVELEARKAQPQSDHKRQHIYCEMQPLSWNDGERGLDCWPERLDLVHHT